MPAALSPLSRRWLVVVGAILIQLALGCIYAWSVFTPYLRKPPYGLTATQTQIIFSVGLATFAVVMVLAGRWMARVGPRRVALAGGLTLGVGYILAGLFGQSFPADVLFIGLVGGAGIGLGYVTPIAVGMRWYPDKKGLITGLAVAGFGLGALFWIQLAGPWGHLLDNLSLGGLPGVQSVFLAYGLLFALMVCIGALWMEYPPEGWQPKGWTPPAAVAGTTAAGSVEFESSVMLHRPQYFMLLVTFIFSSLAGLMTIGVIGLFGIDALKAGGLPEAAAKAAAATAAGVFLSLFNGAGRIVWGRLSDSLGWKRSMVLMTAIQGVVMLAFFWMGQTTALLFLGAALIGFNFGGNFALFPVATADLFGAKSVGKNYGWVFLAYGAGGILGPIMAGYFKDAGAAQGHQAWLPAFLISGVLCLVAAAIASRVTRPEPPAVTAA
jgi:MFS transporter, OFA family, oxalate/formate antiporter